MLPDLAMGLDWPLPTLPPAWLFFAAALLCLLFRGERGHRIQAAIAIATPLAGFLFLLALQPGEHFVWRLQDVEFVHLRVDRLSHLFGILFHLGALLGAIYALRARDTLQTSAALAYAGSALGAVLAGDLLTLFVYWEVMAASSALLVFAGRSAESSNAAFRYLLLHLLSGLLLLAGAVIIYQTTGDLRFDFIGTESLAGWLVLLAFGIKCGFPLLHSWIVDAYPQSTPGGTVFLSMFTTKVAVYGLARGFPGTELLVFAGTVMALFPIFYAVIENDLRRVLGYSMINQIGFMVVGVGVGTELALNGAVAHAFNEVLFKGLLFMSMGAVLYRVGHVLGSDLGALYKSMPRTTLFCVVGAASISAFPLFNGFVSKSMIMSAMLGQGYSVAWLGLLFASAGVFHHAGIKIPYFAFFAHDSGLRTKEAPGHMLVAMAIAAALCVLVGSQPSLLYEMLPWAAGYAPYTYSHVLLQLQLLLFSALAFAWLKLTGIYPPELRSVNLDVDWVYRRLLPGAWNAAGSRAIGAMRALSSALPGWWSRRGLQQAVPRRSLYRSAETSTAAVLVGTLLAGYLFIYYVSA